MSKTTISGDRLNVYQHHKGKYQSLNFQNQTLKRYVIGQKYRVGTGLALVQSSPSQTQKIHVTECSYKEFLSSILDRKIALSGEILAFKWLPKKVVREKTVIVQKCGDHCIDVCKKPGCVCNPDKEICE